MAWLAKITCSVEGCGCSELESRSINSEEDTLFTCLKCDEQFIVGIKYKIISKERRPARKVVLPQPECIM